MTIRRAVQWPSGGAVKWSSGGPCEWSPGGPCINHQEGRAAWWPSGGQGAGAIRRAVQWPSGGPCMGQDRSVEKRFVEQLLVRQSGKVSSRGEAGAIDCGGCGWNIVLFVWMLVLLAVQWPSAAAVRWKEILEQCWRGSLEGGEGGGGWLRWLLLCSSSAAAAAASATTAAAPVVAAAAPVVAAAWYGLSRCY